MPTGVHCCRICAFQIFATMRSMSPIPGSVNSPKRRALPGALLRDVMKLNSAGRKLQSPRPDETEFESPGAVFEVTDRMFMGELRSFDTQISPEGRVMEVLSEHLCQGWLEGYLLTGRATAFSPVTRRSSTSSIRC